MLSNHHPAMTRTAMTTKPDAGAERIYAGQQRGARVAERRQRFIEAGIRQFGSLGYQTTTVRSLCTEAELSTRYFYESFDSVEAVLIASYQQLMHDFRERLLQ